MMGFRVWLHCYLLKASKFPSLNNGDITFHDNIPRLVLRLIKDSTLESENQYRTCVDRKYGALGEKAWLFHLRPAGGAPSQGDGARRETAMRGSAGTQVECNITVNLM